MLVLPEHGMVIAVLQRIRDRLQIYHFEEEGHSVYGRVTITHLFQARSDPFRGAV